MANLSASDSITVSCEHGEHDCHGYVAPLVYSDTRPCSCSCHDARGRDFAAGLARAEASYYGRSPAVTGWAYDEVAS